MFILSELEITFVQYESTIHAYRYNRLLSYKNQNNFPICNILLPTYDIRAVLCYTKQRVELLELK